MRLLHRRHDDAGAGAAAAKSEADRRADPRRAGAASVPLRHPYAHPARGAPRLAADGYGRAVRASGARNERPHRPRHPRSPPAACGQRRPHRQLFALQRVRPGSGCADRTARAETAGKPLPPRLTSIPGSGSMPTAASPCSPARPSSGRGSRRRSSRSRRSSSMCSFASLKVVTADTKLTANEGYTSGSHSMQDSGTAILYAAAQARELLRH